MHVLFASTNSNKAAARVGNPPNVQAGPGRHLRRLYPQNRVVMFSPRGGDISDAEGLHQEIDQHGPFDMVVTYDFDASLLPMVEVLEAQPGGRPLWSGPNARTGQLETDKSAFKGKCKTLGLRVPEYHVFGSLSTAYDNVDDLPWDKFVLKVEMQTDNMDRMQTFVAHGKEQAKAFLQYNMVRSKERLQRGEAPDWGVLCEEFIEGYELAVGAFFNGEMFVPPYHYLVEYKPMAGGDYGPNVNEPGVHMIKAQDWTQPYFWILRQWEDTLRGLNYTGYFDCQFIIPGENSKGGFDLYRQCEDGDWDMAGVPDNAVPVILECDIRFHHPAHSLIMAQLRKRHDIISRGTTRGNMVLSFLKELAEGGEPHWDTPRHMLASCLFAAGFPFPDSSRVGNMPIFGLRALIDQGFAEPGEVYFNEEIGEWCSLPTLKMGRLAVINGYGPATDGARAHLLENLAKVQGGLTWARADIGYRPLPAWAMWHDDTSIY
jgi:phosphoribosylamine-glycine ligase